MKKGRQKKVRYVQEMPEITQFSPRGRVGRPDDIELRVDHFEAINLYDLKGLDQTESAKEMGISRPSFGRILREARKIIADALVHGKIIHIRIGDVQVGVRRGKEIPGNRLKEIQPADEAIRTKILEYEVPSQQ